MRMSFCSNCVNFQLSYVENKLLVGYYNFELKLSFVHFFIIIIYGDAFPSFY